MASKPELPVLHVEHQAAWENWLSQQHDTSPGVRLRIAKKGSGLSSVTYEEALESALCYGWIDSQKEKGDEQSWLQRFTPRGPKSLWSLVNKEKAERLIAEGRMKPSGLSAIETAKQNGQWDKAYASQSRAAVPDDFAEALARSSKAKAFFETLDSTNRYAMIFRIQQVKKAETRSKKIEQYIEMLEKGEKIYS
ncbi:YdeI/OmpD-associated family protein [Paenibacillus whitsoniae]|uniref:Bacteriocin-protection protein n=1 Tax=Paenibacillus whitsoniae TaxID=2496558 RepID=A0A430J5Y6_9BACL|nr:YdeI/OmpD-associated family protein [Paenibacillus whitsoniae]RTE02995.1 bacteriocin-protection protein [Paenibacillus whitsoniae]